MSSPSQSSAGAHPIVPAVSKLSDSPATFDSGFISSASGGFSSGELLDTVSSTSDWEQPPSQQQQQQQQPPQPSHKQASGTIAYVDSGLCEDNDDDNDSAAEDDDSMHLDRKSSANEWTCSEPLTDDRNNLSAAGVSASAAKPERIGAANPMADYMALWKVCYIQDDNGDTQLHLSILSKMTKAITNIIRLAPHRILLDLLNDDGQCGMHFAVLTSQPQVIRQLRAAGAKPSQRDYRGNTPLHLACMNNDLECVRALTNPITAEEQQAFAYAERIPLLPADTNQLNYDGEYCVHIAAQRGNVDIVRHLASACNTDLNTREGRSGYTALHIACENRNAELLAFLLSAECQPKLQLEAYTYGQLTAYQLAALVEDSDAMNVLRLCGAQALELSDDDDSEEDSDSDDSSSVGTDDEYVSDADTDDTGAMH